MLPLPARALIKDFNKFLLNAAMLSILSCPLLHGVDYGVTGQIDRVTRIANGSQIEYEIEYTLSANESASVAEGDLDRFLLRGGFYFEDGTTIYPSIPANQLGRETLPPVINEEAGTRTWTGRMKVPLNEHVPRGVELQVELEVTDLFGAVAAVSTTERKSAAGTSPTFLSTESRNSRAPPS